MFIAEQYNIHMHEEFEWAVAEAIPSEFFNCWTEAAPDFVAAYCAI